MATLNPQKSASSGTSLADLTYLTADSLDQAPPPEPSVVEETYLSLITSYHRGKPKFAAMISALLALAVLTACVGRRDDGMGDIWRGVRQVQQR